MRKLKNLFSLLRWRKRRRRRVKIFFSFNGFLVLQAKFPISVSWDMAAPVCSTKNLSISHVVIKVEPIPQRGPLDYEGVKIFSKIPLKSLKNSINIGQIRQKRPFSGFFPETSKFSPFYMYFKKRGRGSPPCAHLTYA